MTKPSYKLKIDKPCTQEWTSMSNTEIGKFCTLCSETVVDLTQRNNADIFQMVKKNSGKLCGRLTQDQLNKTFHFQEPTNSSRFHKLIAGLLLLGTSENLVAINNQNLQKDFVSTFDLAKANLVSEEVRVVTAKDNSKNIVEGMVLDSKTKEPLPFVTIVIKDTKMGVTSDVEGKFRLTIPDSLLTDIIYLRMNYIGYEVAEIVVNKLDLPMRKEFFLEPAETAILGMVEMEVVKKKKWWHRRK